MPKPFLLQSDYFPQVSQDKSVQKWTCLELLFLLPYPDPFFLLHSLPGLMIPVSSQRPGAVLGLHTHCPGLTGPHILEILYRSLVHLFPSLHPRVCPLGQVFLDLCNSHFKGVLVFHFGALHPPLWSKKLSKLPPLSSWVKPFCGLKTYRSECQLLGRAWKDCQNELFLPWGLLSGFSQPSQQLTHSCFTLPVLHQPHHAVLSAWKYSTPPCDPGRLLLIAPPPGSLLGLSFSPTASLVPLRYSDSDSILVHSPLYLYFT